MRKKLVLFGLICLSVVSGVSYFKVKKYQKIRGLKTENRQKTVRGVILPHHHLASEIIIDTYQQLDENYNLIVVLGPNHFYPEIKEMITADADSGMNVDQQLVDKLVDQIDNVSVDNQMVADEHSIGVQQDYLDRFYPDVKILPIVIPPVPYSDDLNSLVDFLSRLPEDTLYIASVDFAHNQTYIEALDHNRETISAIKSNDYDQINKYDDRHLDSPKSIISLMRLMNKLKATEFEVLHDTHGALLTGNPTLQGTSYVIATFSVK